MLFGDAVDLSVTVEEFHEDIIKLQNQITLFPPLIIYRLLYKKAY